ncbi:MAG: FTR1 family protein [Thermomicrobium sp.]|nr:FTR1 family protein [Thermomicrobium sp.]MDW8059587.1 FTR1 family protein [Thermomicrobium sp.]
MTSAALGRPRRLGLLLLALLAIAMAALPLSVRADAGAPAVAVRDELAAIRRLMAQSRDAYRAGDRERALRLARQAYLDHFELVEIPLRVADPNFTFAMEVQFAEWRQAIERGAPADEIDRILMEIDSGLVEVERVVGGPGLAAPAFVTLASFSILFREGIEAILVIAALLGYLGVHQPSLRRPLWIGVLLAVPASLATWLLLVVVLRVVPVGRELLEIAMSLLAVALMISISLWLLRRIDTRRWMEYLRAHAWEAIATGKASAVALLGFTAVYREGAETAVLYQSLVLMARRLETWIALGVLLAAVSLVLIGWAVIALGARLPLRAFLSAAVSIVMLLSIAILGHAVWELQMLGYLPVTVVELPALNRLVTELLGLHPTREVLIAQLALALAYSAAWLWAGWAWYRSATVSRAVRVSD